MNCAGASPSVVSKEILILFQRSAVAVMKKDVSLHMSIFNLSASGIPSIYSFSIDEKGCAPRNQKI